MKTYDYQGQLDKY